MNVPPILAQGGEWGPAPGSAVIVLAFLGFALMMLIARVFLAKHLNHWIQAKFMEAAHGPTASSHSRPVSPGRDVPTADQPSLHEEIA